MPDPRPLTGLFGKVPAHGDFVRRGLPTSFVAPWDAWLQAGIARAREAKGAAWAEVWDTAPAWRFALPAGACGPDAVAGVMLPSEDLVGRRFPITLAALLAPGAVPPSTTWFDVIEAAAMAGRAGRADADALAAAIPLPTADAAGLAAASLPGLDMPAQGLPAPSVAPLQDPWPSGESPDALPGLGNEDVPGGASPDVLSPSGDATEKGEDVLGLLAASARGEPVALPLEAASSVSTHLPPCVAEAPATFDRVAGQDGDVLSFFADAGSAASISVGAMPEPSFGDDSTLALLIGAGRDDAAPSFAPAPDHAGQAPETPEGESLFPSGAAPAPAGDQPAWPPATDAWAASPATPSADPPGADPSGACSFAMLPADPWGTAATRPADPAADARPAPSAHPVAAPPAPEGGGWWTSGGGRVPPMVWALSALPSPEDFAYLLEAEA